MRDIALYLLGWAAGALLAIVVIFLGYVFLTALEAILESRK